MKSKQVQEFKETEIGKIPIDWEVARLKDISTLYVPMRNKPKEFDGDIPWLRIEDLDGKYVSDSKKRRYVTHDVVDKMHLRILPIGTVLCSCTATIGLCAITQKEVVTNQQFIGIHTSDMDNQFLYYYLLTQTKNLINNAHGTIGGYITRKRFEDFQIILPPISEQKLIVKILSDLDSTIENIQHQNHILEQMAQSIFKSWFVDFDGVTEFEDSELGKIPKEWEVSNIGGKLEVILGGTPSRNNGSYWENGNIPWINSGKTNEFRIISPSELITEEGLKKSATRLIPKRTTVLAITGATLGQVSLLEIDSCANQSVIAIKGNDEIPSEYIYYYVKNVIKNIISSQTGGAQQHINRQNVYDANLLVPKKEVIKKYFKISKPILDIISDNCFQIQLLTKTRDILLPKLMSGEIRV